MLCVQWHWLMFQDKKRATKMCMFLFYFIIDKEQLFVFFMLEQSFVFLFERKKNPKQKPNKKRRKK